MGMLVESQENFGNISPEKLTDGPLILPVQVWGGAGCRSAEARQGVSPACAPTEAAQQQGTGTTSWKQVGVCHPGHSFLLPQTGSPSLSTLDVHWLAK